MSTKRFYAWEGQNASAGEPNKTTGRISMYGVNRVFDNEKARDKYVAGFYSHNPSVYCVACSKKELRGYNLGSSVAQFEDDLRGSPVTYIVGKYNHWNTY